MGVAVITKTSVPGPLAENAFADARRSDAARLQQPCRDFQNSHLLGTKHVFQSQYVFHLTEAR